MFCVLGQILSALLERSGPIRLRYWAEEGGGGLLSLYEQPMKFEVFRFLIGWISKLMIVVFFLAVYPLFANQSSHPLFWSFLTVGLLMAATEITSRSLVGRDPGNALRRFTGLYRLSLRLMSPLIVLLAPLLPASMLERTDDDENGVTDDEIEAFISVGTQEGILEPGEEDLIQGVIDFGDSLVESVATPRIDMVCAAVDIDLEALTELFLSSRHSRIPIYQDTVDQIVGILHIRDLFTGLRSDKEPSVLDLAMEPYFVPESKPLSDLLREFQASRQQVEIMVDEYGGTAGMVTVEDLLEEIVGEIEDEHDESTPENELLPDGSWRIDGGAPLETLEELFDVDLEGATSHPLGGLIFASLGYVPKPGEIVDSHGLLLQVESVEDRRIGSVSVKRNNSLDEEISS